MTAAKQPKRVYLKARLIISSGNGRRAFVKVYDSSLRHKKAQSRRLAERERVCLKVLAGLAVPKLVGLPKGELARAMGFEPTSFVAQAFVPGKPLHKAGMTPRELLGIWMFLAEHLVAVRRHQILYTDCKSSNVLVRRKPLKVTLIDFNYATAANADGIYPSSFFGFTAGFQAPEHGLWASLTEQSVVYQFGMLLANSLAGLSNSSLRNAGKGGLDRLRTSLDKMGAAGLAELLGECLAASAGERPESYEAVLERIKLAVPDGVPPKSVRIWKTLRAPYADRLSEVGLSLD